MPIEPIEVFGIFFIPSGSREWRRCCALFNLLSRHLEFPYVCVCSARSYAFSELLST